MRNAVDALRMLKGGGKSTPRAPASPARESLKVENIGHKGELVKIQALITSLQTALTGLKTKNCDRYCRKFTTGPLHLQSLKLS